MQATGAISFLIHGQYGNPEPRVWFDLPVFCFLLWFWFALASLGSFHSALQLSHFYTSPSATATAPPVALVTWISASSRQPMRAERAAHCACL